MPEAVLFCWLGGTDITVSKRNEAPANGPIGRAVNSRHFDRIVLLNNYPPADGEVFAYWLKGFYGGDIEVHDVSLGSPMDFSAIYLASDALVRRTREAHPDASFTFHTSPGTPAMAAIWVLLAKARHEAQLIQTSSEEGLTDVDFPFELAAEFVPKTLASQDGALSKLIDATPPDQPEFSQIVHQCPEMRAAIALAQRFATRDVPVLIHGETGTGKELFARAIHQASPRARGPFVAVNCGAIPNELIDAELFGYEKGAFTGAVSATQGYFETASGGTLFLDEIAELPPSSQVRLLRVLQEKEVTRVGAKKPIKVDFRVLAASHRDLEFMCQESTFRLDLYYRLAVGVLDLPPLRRREGDVSKLIDSILSEINKEAQALDPSYLARNLEPNAKKLLLKHHWPGNVRELKNILLRATIWSSDCRIRPADIRGVLVNPNSKRSLERDTVVISDRVSLIEEIEHLSRKRIQESLVASGGNKSKAAKLLGFKSHQVLSGWMRKYEITGI